jgi:hypothetical protein
MKNTTNPYSLSSRRSVKRRGNVMAMVLATIFILTTIVLGFHHQQTVARNSLTRSEADLRFRESKNFALRDHLLGVSSPWGLKVGVDLEETTPETTRPIEENYAQSIFQRKDGKWSGLPDLSAEGTAHAHKYLTLETSGFGGLNSGVRKGSYKIVETEIPGYAAYAPNGSIQLGEVLGWQNPNYDEAKGSSEAYSGVPAIVAAQGDITIEELAYGEAHSHSGDIEIEDGAGIGFRGALPLAPYQSNLEGQLDNALATLSGSTHTGNKTRLISDHTGIGDILSIMFGGGNFNPERLLSLRQATKFPTPMIPGLSMVVPGVVWEVWLHVPFQPDLGFSSKHDPDLSRLEDIQKEQEEAAVLLEEARLKVEETKAVLQVAQAAYNANPSEQNEEALEDAQEDHDKAVTRFHQVENFLADSSKKAGRIASGKLGSGISSLPQTRLEDPSSKDGQWGWNYSKTIEKMFNLVTTLVKTQSFKAIAESVSENVRVVHYGPEDEVPGFEWNGNTFLSKSTWTVPASRTLRYDGNMEIRGDLWLQRGTVMMVQGDLRLAAPNGIPSLTDSSKPSGRVFFEEGSTLIVGGDFECQGSPEFGSIMVGGEPGEIHPITSGLFVEGDIRIPNGIYAGHTIADLITAIGLPGVEAGANTVHNLLSQQAPLLSKLAGPFHLRNPYFARFATTFQLVTIPFPPVVAVTPIPSQRENLHVFAFRAETFAYTAGLNATLGENLYPQADWWPFGNGVVPMALNLDLPAVITASGKAATLVDSAELDPDAIEAEVTNFVEVLAERSINWAIEEGIDKLTKEGAKMLTPDAFGKLIDNVELVMDALEEDEQGADQFYEEFVGRFEDRIGSLGKDLLGDILERTDVSDSDDYLKEYAGLLVRGRNIYVGADAKQISGMFVAENDIVIEADLTVGTLLSMNGSIRVEDFLYYPYFNQASLYLPKAVPGDKALERALHRDYGEANDSGLSVQVGPPSVTNAVTAGGWER